MTSTPKVLVLGAGSSGARHARTLHAAGARVTVTDPDPERLDAIDGIETVAFDPTALHGYEGIVVASPSAHHGEQAVAALATGAHVLVEKPMVADPGELTAVLDAEDGRLMVGLNLRLHEPVQQMFALVRSGRLGTTRSVRLWFGSWLPDWRPAYDYRLTYSARSDLGGGVLLDAVHELDLAVWLLDDRLTVIGAAVDRTGVLEADVEDRVHCLLRHHSGAVVDVSLDYLSRRYRRGIEVVGDAATARLDWARGVLEVEDGDGVVTEPVTTSVLSSYERQARRFLAFMAGDAVPPVDGPTGAASVRLAAAIRSAA